MLAKGSTTHPVANWGRFCPMSRVAQGRTHISRIDSMRILGLVGLCALSLLVFAAISQQKPPLEVRNNTTMAIESISVSIAGHGIELPGSGPGQVLSIPLELHRDGPLEIELRFENGQLARISGGYFTPGMVGGNALTGVAPDSLDLSSL